jgi:7-cyano-7-deazaguanine reductase
MLMTDASKSLLGKETDYSASYTPTLLFPLDRKQNRENLKLSSALPFHGEDIWTGYELSWLNLKGKPVVSIADFHFPADSISMIESKSFKLYLNSLNNECFESSDKVKALLETDLSLAAGAEVKVNLLDVDSGFPSASILTEYYCLDELDVEGFEYQPNKALLSIIDADNVSESLCSHLLRSNCPVTGQPDWASIYIDYTGPKIQAEGLLKYIVSFRQCQDFHEHCVERIFTDLMSECQCQSLSVYARYTRRGGLDINPYRATFDRELSAPAMRVLRQ